MARLQEGGRKEGEKWEMGCEGGGCMMGGRGDVGREMWGWGGEDGKEEVREGGGI